MTKKLKIILIWIIAILVIAIILHHKSYIIEKTFVNGNSMNPSFYNWEIICLYKNYYSNYNDVRDLDIIGFALKNKWNFIKRIIAKPWDKIIFWKDWFIYKNNQKLEEKYIKTNQKFNKNNLKLLLTQLEYYNNIIPEHMFLVMWDNRLNSFDSWVYWLIDFDHILWKVYKSIKWYCF